MLDPSKSSLKRGTLTPAPQTEHPWMKFPGMHKDNPLFAEVLEYIEAERRELNFEQYSVLHSSSM